VTSVLKLEASNQFWTITQLILNQFGRSLAQKFRKFVAIILLHQKLKKLAGYPCQSLPADAVSSGVWTYITLQRASLSPTASYHLANSTTIHRRREEPAKQQPGTTRNGSEGQQGKDEKVGIQGMPFTLFFITVFDTQPSKFSSCPSLARKARRRGLLYIFTFFYHIRTLPPSLARNARRRGVPSSTSSPHQLNPSAKHVKHACWHVLHVPFTPSNM